MYESGCVICELVSLVNQPSYLLTFGLFLSIRPYRCLHQYWVIWM